MEVNNVQRTDVPAIAGAVNPVTLKKTPSNRTLISFSGSLVGTVVVTAKVLGGDRLQPVTDGTIDLAVRNYMYIPDIPLEELNLNYSGVAPLSAVVYQMMV